MKFKKLLAVATAFAMTLSMVPSQAFAATEPNATGSGTVEADNSTAPGVVGSFVVPTAPNGTYDFTLDAQKLLNQYDNNSYNATDTVFFNAKNAAAKLTAVDNKTKDSKFYKAFKAKGDLATLNGDDGLQAATVEDATSLTAFPAGYYVWTPTVTESTPTGNGEYTELTKDNYSKYLDLTIGGTSPNFTFTFTAKADHLSGSDVFDGNIYETKYTALDFATTDDADEFVTYSTGTISAVNSDLYVIDNTTEKQTKLTTANVNDYATYTAGTSKYTNTTNELTIINKKTAKADVAVTVTAKNTAGLNFVNSNSFTGMTDASVYMAIVDKETADSSAQETAIQTAGDVSSATVTYTLDAATEEGSIKYQGGTNAATGGHNYYQYHSPSTAYDSYTFTITGAANDNTTAAEAWTAYANGLTATTRPSLEIVYSLVDHEETLALTSDSDNEVAATFTVGGSVATSAAAGAEVTVVPGAAPAGEVVDQVTAYKTGDTETAVTVSDTNTFTMPAYPVTVKVTYKADALALASDSDNEVAATFTVDGSAVTSANIDDVVTIVPGAAPSGKALNAVTAYKTGDAETAVTVSDTNTFTMPAYAVTVKVTYKAATDSYVMTGDKTSGVSYTFINAPAGSVTALYVDNVDRIGGVSAGNVTYTSGRLFFNPTSVTGTGLATTGNHTIKATIGGKVYTLTYTAK